MLISGKVSITGLNPLPLFMGSVLFIFLCYPVSLFVLDQDFFVIKYIFHFHLHFLLTMKLKKRILETTANNLSDTTDTSRFSA